jgi:hypothetical protein
MTSSLDKLIASLRISQFVFVRTGSGGCHILSPAAQNPQKNRLFDLFPRKYLAYHGNNLLYTGISSLTSIFSFLSKKKRPRCGNSRPFRRKNAFTA